MTQDEFSKQLENAYKEALKQADAITADAERIRKEAEKERDAAEEARRITEQEGERMANEYYEGKRKQFIEATRTELLRDLSRMHIELGKSNHEISLLLNVEQKFVQKIRDVVERVAKLHSDRPQRPLLEGSPRVWFTEDRDGRYVHFDSLEGHFFMWVEFGVGNIVLIGVPNPEHWEAKTGIPCERRERVLTYVAECVIDEKMGGQGSFLIGADVVSVFKEDADK